MDAQTQLPPETLVSRGKELKFTKLDDEMLAIDAQAGHCYSLNETAGEIWGYIATPVTLADLCARLQAAHEVDAEICTNDTIELLVKLHDAGLVKFNDVTFKDEAPR
jgi:hypothetical protein